MFYKEYFHTNAINAIIFKEKIKLKDTHWVLYRIV